MRTGPITPTVRIVAPPASALAALAASMSAGTWAQLTIPGQNSVLGDTVVGGGGSNTQYSDSMHYIPQSDSVQYVGLDHAGPEALGMHVIEYLPATNQWVFKANGYQVVPGAGSGHGFDHAAVNPYTGDAYQVLYGPPIVPFRLSVRRRPFGSNTFTQTLPQTSMEQAINITFGVCWWSGSFTGGSGAGAQGCLLVYNVGGSVGNALDGDLSAYDPLSNTWFYGLHGATPFWRTNGTGNYHNLAEYSAAFNCAVIGGGNSGPDKIWRVNSNGTTTQLTNPPRSIGIQRGNLTTDPVTGKFLLFAQNELWELDPTGVGTWTQQTGLRAPPAGLPCNGIGTNDGTIAVAMPAPYNVVFFANQLTSTTDSA